MATTGLLNKVHYVLFGKEKENELPCDSHRAGAMFLTSEHKEEDSGCSGAVEGSSSHKASSLSM